MENKKGLSAVVTTLIIILLVLVAVGIIWVVVRNVVDQGAAQIGDTFTCTSLDFSVTAASCAVNSTSNNWNCDVTYTRKSGGDDVDGVKIILSNGQKSYSKDVSGNVAVLDTNTESNIETNLVNSTDVEPNTAEIAPYFINEAGDESLCNPVGTFEF